MVSIIVPVYNVEKYIKQCVLSIINQTYTELQIILVDDGSTDSSVALCEELAQQDSRVTVVRKQNGGVSSARNEGLSLAKGEYIQFVDSDDYIKPNMCEALVHAATNDSSDLVLCGYKRQSETEALEVCPEKNETVSVAEFANMIDFYYKQWLLNSPCNKLYKRALIKSDFDESLSLGEDLLFNLEYIKQSGSISLLSSPLYIYNTNVRGSLTKRVRSDFLQELGTVYEKTVSHLKAIYGSSFSASAFTEMYVSDVFMSLARRAALCTAEEKEKVLSEISALSQDEGFFTAANKVSLNSKQRSIVLSLLKRKRVKTVYCFYKILKRAGN